MGGCAPNIVTQLIKTYGEKKIMDYVYSEIGTKFLGQEFEAIKNQITQRFNNSAMYSNSKNMNIFDEIIGKVVNN